MQKLVSRKRLSTNCLFLCLVADWRDLCRIWLSVFQTRGINDRAQAVPNLVEYKLLATPPVLSPTYHHHLEPFLTTNHRIYHVNHWFSLSTTWDGVPRIEVCPGVFLYQARLDCLERLCFQGCSVNLAHLQDLPRSQIRYGWSRTRPCRRLLEYFRRGRQFCSVSLSAGTPRTN